CAVVPTLNSGMQYMTDGKRKYIWYPGAGDEHYFDIENDPTEMHNLAESAGHRADIDTWRGLLVEELEGRSEGFVDKGRLNTLGGPTAVAMHWVTPTGGPFAMA
ncbi:MAG: hypothetical protein J4F38_04320, partial [Pseudomonadales bacterium]|nr:hypothetical protein [Pseudomonadales bacterium]